MLSASVTYLVFASLLLLVLLGLCVRLLYKVVIKEYYPEKKNRPRAVILDKGKTSGNSSRKMSLRDSSEGVEK